MQVRVLSGSVETLALQSQSLNIPRSMSPSGPGLDRSTLPWLRGRGETEVRLEGCSGGPGPGSSHENGQERVNQREIPQGRKIASWS